MFNSVSISCHVRISFLKIGTFSTRSSAGCNFAEVLHATPTRVLVLPPEGPPEFSFHPLKPPNRCDTFPFHASQTFGLGTTPLNRPERFSTARPPTNFA